MDFYSAYGASPQAMSWSEVFTALQQGTIDGHDNSISTIVSNNVQEIQPYMTVSRHTYEAFTFMANTANFTSKLSEEDQALVLECVEAALQGGQRPNRGRRGRAHPVVHRRERR